MANLSRYFWRGGGGGVGGLLCGAYFQIAIKINGVKIY